MAAALHAKHAVLSPDALYSHGHRSFSLQKCCGTVAEDTLNYVRV